MSLFTPPFLGPHWILTFAIMALGSASMDAAQYHKSRTTSVRAPVTAPSSAPTFFFDVDKAFETLVDGQSALQWEASYYLRNHPEEATARLEQLIVAKHPAWFIAMCTLTDIGGKSVVTFYCDLLDRNRYEMDEKGERKVYGISSPLGCMKPHYMYGEAIVAQLGVLGDPSAEPCLQRAWLDSDSAVSAAVPKARYDIGTLSLASLQQQAGTDENHRDLYFKTLLEIGYHHIHDRTDFAIELFEWILIAPAAGQDPSESAHTALIQCHELKKDYAKALEHCDWVIANAATEEMSRRRRTERPELLYLQGKLSADDFFALAKKDPELYDRIAQRLGRMKSDVSVFDRIIREAPEGSAYQAQAEYWKLEYFDSSQMPERARVQAQFILSHVKNEAVLNWVRQWVAKDAAQKEKKPGERTASGR